jgi:hypothetical protein
MVHNQIRSGITGGLSNVWHRKNIAGETMINKLYYQEIGSTQEVISMDTTWPMTHSTGIDANSLYPSSSGSIKVPWNPYDNGVMYMPGNLLLHTKNEESARNIFAEIYATRYQNTDEEAKQGLLFIATIKGHIPDEYKNDFINMPPLIRNIEIDASNEDVIGEKTFKQIENLKMKRGKERKLTQLLDTNGQYMTFGSYYLYFLMDMCHFVVEEVKEISVFHKTDCFNKFVTTYINRRIKAMKENNNGYEKYCKMMLNSSYGYDILNGENFSGN